MGSNLTSYLDFAENDYLFFRRAYDEGNKGGPLAALGQNICERYLKHIISEYAHPESEQESIRKESVLRTHSLHRLMHYLQEDMSIRICEDTEDALDRIDGFYFSTRYPGDESFIPTERDVDKANEAVECARNLILRICQELENPGQEIH